MAISDGQGQETIQALKEQRAKINAKIKKAQKAEAEKQKKRKQKRHEIAGAVILAEAESNPELWGKIYALLEDKVTRPDERALFDFLNAEGQGRTPADYSQTGDGD